MIHHPVVNFFAGPGCGKSTISAGLFYRLKNRGICAELSGEYAKDLTWARRHHELRDQLYVFAKQQARVARLSGECDVVISDSPLLLSLIYVPEGYPPAFSDLVRHVFARYDNVNFLLTRHKPYESRGRSQTLEEARLLDLRMREMLLREGVPYTEIPGNEDGLRVAEEMVLARLAGRPRE